MADLSQFRGKRALVCGIPRDGAKTQQAWLDATDKAMRGLGIVGAETHEPLSVRSVIRSLATSKADVVLLAGNVAFCLASVRVGAIKSGIPVLRVRRDGSVEVDDATP